MGRRNAAGTKPAEKTARRFPGLTAEASRDEGPTVLRPPDAARSNSSALLLIPLPGEVKELEAKLL